LGDEIRGRRNHIQGLGGRVEAPFEVWNGLDIDEFVGPGGEVRGHIKAQIVQFAAPGEQGAVPQNELTDLAYRIAIDPHGKQQRLVGRPRAGSQTDQNEDRDRRSAHDVQPAQAEVVIPADRSEGIFSSGAVV
jgi:hypothetical protein